MDGNFAWPGALGTFGTSQANETKNEVYLNGKQRD